MSGTEHVQTFWVSDIISYFMFTCESLSQPPNIKELNGGQISIESSDNLLYISKNKICRNINKCKIF